MHSSSTVAKQLHASKSVEFKQKEGSNFPGEFAFGFQQPDSCLGEVQNPVFSGEGSRKQSGTAVNYHSWI